MKLVVYSDRHPRSKHIANSLYAGAEVMGWEREIIREEHSEPRGDMIAGYGWRNKKILEMYKENGGHYFYVDLGYWGRKHYQSDYGGYHKVVLDGRHPTKYFQKKRNGSRLNEDSPQIQPWTNSGKHIVLAGLSGKGAQSLGLEPYEWETKTIKNIKQSTDRRIVYRPKPSWAQARPINGTDFSSGHETINEVLKDAWALVTYYSNAAIDALMSGVPIVSEDGPAKIMGGKFDTIEKPYRPDNREQFLCDISYCHWLRREIADGKMFQQFIDDGLI